MNNLLTVQPVLSNQKSRLSLSALPGIRLRTSLPLSKTVKGTRPASRAALTCL